MKIHFILGCWMLAWALNLGGVKGWASGVNGVEIMIEAAGDPEDTLRETQRSLLAQFRFDVDILKKRGLHEGLEGEVFEEKLKLALRDQQIEEADLPEEILKYVPNLRVDKRDTLTESDFEEALKKARGFKQQDALLQKHSVAHQGAGGGGVGPLKAEEPEGFVGHAGEGASQEEQPLELLGNSGVMAAAVQKKASWRPTFLHGAALGAVLTAGLFFLTKSKGPL